jgi:SAM-dependent methyltransferase
MGHDLYGALARYYDRIYAAKDYAGEAAEITRRARRAVGRGPRTLLDVACGTGRHLEWLRREFTVRGSDASVPMLREARRRLGPGVPLQRADMRTHRARPPVDVIICLFSAIGYLRTARDRHAAFRAFFDSLRPGGVAIIEGWLTPAAFRPGSIHLQTYNGPEAKIARLSRAQRRGGDSWIEMEYLVLEPKGPVRWYREVHRQPLVAPKQMLAELRRAGFTARVVLDGRWAQRGLYLARRPAAPRSARATRP